MEIEAFLVSASHGAKADGKCLITIITSNFLAKKSKSSTNFKVYKTETCYRSLGKRALDIQILSTMTRVRQSQIFN